MERKIEGTYGFAYIMTFVGGFLGAYSYVLRGGVFASAQTGNLILFGISISQGQFAQWYRFVIPIFAFVFGVVIADRCKLRYSEHDTHWKWRMFVAEIAILSMVSFIPLGNLNLFANIGIALASGIQTESFRIANTHTHTTTMCTGNIRAMTEFLFYAIRYGNKENISDGIKWALAIVFFVLGVVVGAFLSDFLSIYSLLVPAFILAVICAIYLLKYE